MMSKDGADYNMKLYAISHVNFNDTVLMIL